MTLPLHERAFLKAKYTFIKLKRRFKHRMRFLKWYLRISFGRSVDIFPDKSKATVLLNSFMRVKNIDPIVKACLKCRFIEKVIVSNNNPEYRIEDWVKSRDKRVILINQPVRKRCRIRWVVAARHKSEYYIAIDDDLFIYPEQLKFLFTQLLKNPAIPHSLFGTIISKSKDASSRFESTYLLQAEEDVDVIHQIYAVTREHVRNYFKLLRNIYTTNRVAAGYLRKRGDDITISHTGDGRPAIHDAGFVLECQTNTDPNLATFKQEGFYNQREEILETARILTNR